MLTVPAGNKLLKYVDLSHNNLVSQSATPAAPINYGNTLETIFEDGPGSQGGTAKAASKFTQIKTGSKLTNQQQEVLDCLAKFIKRNKNLIHLNLEATGLTYEMIKLLLVSVKASRSLQGIHLCGNPGVNEMDLIHYTVNLLDPINFSEWDDIAVAGKPASRSKARRAMSSAMTNRAMSRAALNSDHDS